MAASAAKVSIQAGI